MYGECMSKLPETMDLFRGTSKEEYNNIVTNKTEPGRWWTLHLRKAIHYATKGFPGERGIIIMRNCDRNAIRSINPDFNEVRTIYGYDYSKMSFDFIPLSTIMEIIQKMIEKKWNVHFTETKYKVMIKKGYGTK